MTVDRKRLRDLALAATPGPWRVHAAWDKEHENVVRTVRDSSLMSHEVAITTTGDVTDEREQANTDFIAHANPRDILELLDALDAAEQPAPDDASPSTPPTDVSAA